VDGFHEPAGAAIHDRDFGAVDFDQGIVDTETAESGKEMLDGGNGKSIAIAKHRTQGDPRHIAVVSAQFGAFGIAVGEKETKPGVAISRIKGDGNGRSAMYPCARK